MGLAVVSVRGGASIKLVNLTMVNRGLTLGVTDGK